MVYFKILKNFFSMYFYVLNTILESNNFLTRSDFEKSRNKDHKKVFFGWFQYLLLFHFFAEDYQL